MKRLWLLGSSLYLAWNYYNRSLGPTFMCDFNAYYNFAHHGDRKEWYYADWLANIWIVIESYPVWYILSSFCVLILVWKLLEVRHGWIFVAPFCKVAGWTLGSGNIQPILALACITPLGCLVAGLVKPQLLGLMAFHALARYRHEVAHAKQTAVAPGSRPHLHIPRDRSPVPIQRD